MKRTELKKLIKEDISSWLSERAKDEPKSENISKTEEKIPTLEDQIGEMYYVSKPSKKSSMEELVGKGDVFEFVARGLQRETVHGVYKSENKAKTVAKKLIKERDLQLKETYKKGQAKLKELEGQIDEIKGQIESNMSEAVSNPDMRESLSTESDNLYEKLSKVEGMIAKLREVLETESLRYEKKGKDHDDDPMEKSSSNKNENGKRQLTNRSSIVSIATADNTTAVAPNTAERRRKQQHENGSITKGDVPSGHHGQ